MTSGNVGHALDAFVAGLVGSVQELDAEVDRLTEQAQALLSQAEQRREDAGRQRAVLADLEGRLGQIVGQCLRDRLASHPTNDDPGPRAQSPRAASGQARQKTSAPQGTANSAAGSGLPLIQQVLELIKAEPSRRWSAAMLREHFPQQPTRAFNRILTRLHKRQQVVWLDKGVYRAAADGDGRPEPAPTAVPRPPSADSAADTASGGSESGDNRSLTLDQRITTVIAQPSAGRHYRLDDLATGLGVDVASVHAALQRLLRSGEVVIAIDGSYVLPGGAAVTPDLAVEQRWADVS